MDDERLLRTYTDVDDEWRRVDHLPTTGAVWVVARDGDAVRELAQAHRLSSQALRVLEEHPVAPSSDEESGRHLRGRVDRLTDGELVLSVSTVSYVEQTRDVRTGLLLCVLTDDLLITCERGEADVLTLAADRLCDGPLVPDSGVRQVLAAILLTLVTARPTSRRISVTPWRTSSSWWSRRAPRWARTDRTARARSGRSTRSSARSPRLAERSGR